MAEDKSMCCRIDAPMAPDRQPLTVLHVLVCFSRGFPTGAANKVQVELMAPVQDFVSIVHFLETCCRKE